MSSNETTILTSEAIELRAIQIVQEHYQLSEEFRKAPVVADVFAASTVCAFTYNIESEFGHIELTFKTEGQKDGKPIGVDGLNTYRFVFHVDDLAKMCEPAPSGRNQPRIEVASTLAGIAYSTARGLLFERWRNTHFNGLILKVLSPVAILMNGAMPSVDNQPPSGDQ